MLQFFCWNAISRGGTCYLIEFVDFPEVCVLMVIASVILLIRGFRHFFCFCFVCKFSLETYIVYLVNFVFDLDQDTFIFPREYLLVYFNWKYNWKNLSGINFSVWISGCFSRVILLVVYMGQYWSFWISFLFTSNNNWKKFSWVIMSSKFTVTCTT